MPKHFRIAALFLIAFVVAFAVYTPSTNPDYPVCIRAIRAVLSGNYAYGTNGGRMLPYLMPPWSFLFLVPISGQTINFWLALTTALFVAAAVDLGAWPALLLLAHPGFIGMIASSNPEWLLVGSGLWLLYRSGKHGWLRGVAWLLLACKPQTTFILLIFDGIRAYKQRDWRAFTLAGVTALVSLALIPGFFDGVGNIRWSVSVLYTYGVPAAALATVGLVAMRWTRRGDWRTIGLLLAPLWTPYILQYSILASAFTMRGSGLGRIGLYVVISLLSVAQFWQSDHPQEAISMLVMVLAAGALAINSRVKHNNSVPAIIQSLKPVIWLWPGTRSTFKYPAVAAK